MTQQETEKISQPDKVEQGTAILAAGAIGLATFVAVVELLWKLMFH